MSSSKSKVFLTGKKPNFTYTVISVALVLFLLGLCAMLLLNAKHFVHTLKENVKVFVEIDPNVTKKEKAFLIEQLKFYDSIKKNSLNYISKEDAFESLKNDLGEDFNKYDFPNPLYDQISFNLNADYLQSDSLVNLKESIAMNQLVNDVYYEEGLVVNIDKNLIKLGYAALFIGLIFLLVAIVLIHNTMKLALFSNRFLIKNMELVGASWGFISRPYLSKSLSLGFISSLLAIVFLIFILFVIQRSLPELVRPEYMSSFATLFIALTVIGVLITFGSTYFVVNKYLKMRIDDLY